jgi:hypothetical protein
MLAGHTNLVNGACILTDGRILSWSWDGTLRLWSSEGAGLVTLTGHAAGVSLAKELPTGQLLSWCNSDGTLRLWSAEGIPVGNWPVAQAPEALLKELMVARGQDCLVRHDGVVRQQHGCVSVAGAYWHSTAEPQPRAWFDSSVAVTLHGGDLLFLTQYLGARRITAAEMLDVARARGFG